MNEKLEYADFLESGAYVKKLEETYNRYLDIRDKKLVEFMKENKRLHSIIKEVREYIETEYLSKFDDIERPLRMTDKDDWNKILEILRR